MKLRLESLRTSWTSLVSSFPLVSSSPMLMSPTRGFGMWKSALGVDLAHHRELLEVARLAVRVGAHVEQHRAAGRDAGTTAASAGPVHLLERAQRELGDRPAGGGVARGEEGVGRAVAHQLHGDLDRRALLERGAGDRLRPCRRRPGRPRPRWRRSRAAGAAQLLGHDGLRARPAATWRPSSRQAATAPSTTTRGPWSPPRASTATRAAGLTAAGLLRLPPPPSPACPCSSRSCGQTRCEQLGLVAVGQRLRPGAFRWSWARRLARAGLRVAALGVRHRFSSFGAPRRGPAAARPPGCDGPTGLGVAQGSLVEQLAAAGPAAGPPAPRRAGARLLRCG